MPKSAPAGVARRLRQAERTEQYVSIAEAEHSRGWRAIARANAFFAANYCHIKASYTPVQNAAEKPRQFNPSPCRE